MTPTKGSNPPPHPSRGSGGDYPPRRRGPGEAEPLLVITLATAKEYKAALSPLGAPAAPAIGDAVAWRRGGRDFLAVVTGVGPVAAALTLGRVLGRQEGEMRGVLNLGVTGSFDLAVAPLGGLVAATVEIFPEYGLRGQAGTDPRGIVFPQLTVDGEPVFDRLPLAPEASAKAMGLTLPGETALGPCVTVAGVTGDRDRAACLARDHAAIGESMEGFAVALAAAVAGLPFLELRSVSNRVGSRPPEGWDLAGALTALGRATAILFS